MEQEGWDIVRALRGGELAGNGPMTRGCAMLLEQRLGCARAILTPSGTAALEMAALLGLTNAEVEQDRSSAVSRAAELFGAVVVLKGSSSLVGSPDGRLSLNPTGNPGMASAGTGDVLTGLLGSLLAQPRQFSGDPHAAAAAAVYLHGLAGDRAAAAFGEASLLASHITDAVPDTLASVVAGEAEEAWRWR